MKKIKPCPFCGRDVNYYQFQDDEFAVECRNENCKVKPYAVEMQKNSKEAMIAWNTRVESHAIIYIDSI